MGQLALGVHQPETPEVLKNSRSFWNCYATNLLIPLTGTMLRPALNRLEKGLITDKEWEFAARNGLINKECSWREGESSARDYANFKET